MAISRRFLVTAIPFAFLVSSAAHAQDKSWDGTWTGMQVHPPGAPWPISITIADGKVTSYIASGSPFDIKYSTITPTHVTFGDRDHYIMKIKRTSDTTASSKIHGRHGTARALLTRQ